MWSGEERRVEEARALQEKMEREKKALQASAEKVGCCGVDKWGAA
jgi:hypothetical protein